MVRAAALTLAASTLLTLPIARAEEPPNWTVRTQVSPLDGSTRVMAFTQSQLDFFGNPPAIPPTFTVRCIDGEFAFFISMNKSVPTVTPQSKSAHLMVRFDEQPAEDDRWVVFAGDNLIPDGRDRIINFLRRAFRHDRLYVKAVEGSALTEAVFDLRGLRPVMRTAAEACDAMHWLDAADAREGD